MNRLLHLAIFALLVISAGCSDKAPSYLDEIRARADKGDAEAQNRLGLIYGIGEGVEQDRVEAARWFRLAAMQGEANAQYHLGLQYITKNDVEAYAWFSVATAFGHDVSEASTAILAERILTPEELSQAEQRAAELIEKIDSVTEK